MSMMTTREVAEYCGLSPRAIYRAVERGELRATKLCSRLRIRQEDVEAWIEHNTVAPEPANYEIGTGGARVSRYDPGRPYGAFRVLNN